MITTETVTKLQSGFALLLPGRENATATPTDIPQIPSAGPALRDAYFGLSDGSVAVAPNEPQTVYYVLTLDKRVPATFSALYAPNGDYFRYRGEAMSQAFKKRDDDWMSALRAQAGLKPDWTPSDEAKEKDAQIARERRFIHLRDLRLRRDDSMQ